LEQINLHKPIISEYSSIIAKNNEIRKILKKFQITFSKKNIKCCIEGRDISTKILPNSDLKFYFKCNLTIAAKRRFQELKNFDPNIKLKDVKKALKIRNFLDTKRKHSPLLKHRNSVEIDTGKLNKQEMLRKMSANVEKVLLKKYGN
jgi:cytidylate kinase